MPRTTVDPAGLIRQRGWQQGSILFPGQLAMTEHALPDLPPDAFLLVLTHDCDLVQPDFEKEPFVEFLVVLPIPRIDGNFAHGRHPRYLDFAIGEGCFRAFCHHRHRRPRICLKACAPLETHPVDDSLCDLVTRWIAKRYTRPAFPDAFNLRLSRDQRAIKRFFQSNGHHFRDILINCTPRHDELNDGNPYQLIAWLVLAPDATLSETERQTLTIGTIRWGQGQSDGVMSCFVC